jgi:hypothetical protein
VSVMRSNNKLSSNVDHVTCLALSLVWFVMGE